MDLRRPLIIPGGLGADPVREGQVGAFPGQGPPLSPEVIITQQLPLLGDLPEVE